MTCKQDENHLHGPDRLPVITWRWWKVNLRKRMMQLEVLSQRHVRHSDGAIECGASHTDGEHASWRDGMDFLENAFRSFCTVTLFLSLLLHDTMALENVFCWIWQHRHALLIFNGQGSSAQKPIAICGLDAKRSSFPSIVKLVTGVFPFHRFRFYSSNL